MFNFSESRDNKIKIEKKEKRMKKERKKEIESEVKFIVLL